MGPLDHTTNREPAFGCGSNVENDAQSEPPLYTLLFVDSDSTVADN
jgi:hypothetical protein